MEFKIDHKSSRALARVPKWLHQLHTLWLTQVSSELSTVLDKISSLNLEMSCK